MFRYFSEVEQMCFCTVILLKCSLVLAIILLAILSVLDTVEDIQNHGQTTARGQMMLIMCYVLNSFIIVILCAGVYAAIREKLKLLQLLILALITYFLGKMSLWIVVGNQGVLELLVVHFWYQLTLIDSLVCIVLLTCFCLRIKDDDGEDPPFS
ncbi:uncharacterized protein LOC117579558 [Drosophila guanche]|uniref:Uncharacterized protein n=1 Tax=Drosophila guanche TaxID=7266 RepID=A0A3B0JV04_DROGU|nr:uncharacterized protein LOC117579558 [Drosophila guanche]SPP77196.1 Hypothetical predicted protein [Drosophila guanche]